MDVSYERRFIRLASKLHTGQSNNGVCTLKSPRTWPFSVQEAECLSNPILARRPGDGAAVCPHCFPKDGQWLPANSKEGEAGSTGFLWASLNLDHNWQVLLTVEKALSLLSPSWKCLHRQPRGPLN